jgi:hypothetical protein
MVIELIPGLDSAWVEPGQSEPVSFGEFIAPSFFTCFFNFEDSKTRAQWDLIFSVSVSELGTPKLSSVQIYGNSLSGKKDGERDGVERWQLKVAEQYRAQLLSLALRLAVETRWPTVMLRREYSAETAALSRALTKAGIKPNDIVLEHPSKIKGKLKSGESADFVRFWDGNREPLQAKELQKLQKLIGVKVRQKISRDLLAEVAEIYNEEGSRPGGKPVMAIRTRYNCSYRTAQDYVRKARKEKLLPPTTSGKVTVKKSKPRKEIK